MAVEPLPNELPDYVRELQCKVCGHQKWRIHGMVICKNCHWRAVEAEKQAKEAKT